MGSDHTARTRYVLGSSRVVTAAEFSVTPWLRDRVAQSNATPRSGLEPASASAHRKILWMGCGGPRVHWHIESPATRFGSLRVCIGTSKRPMDGLWESTSASAHRKSCNTVWESASVHWHVENAFETVWQSASPRHITWKNPKASNPPGVVGSEGS